MSALSEPALTPALDSKLFRRRLMVWYRRHARKLPWRGIEDPYRTWLSEVMLQQTRVAAVIEHYHRFLTLFPTMEALACAPEADVLAAWSGLGYYRRARMLHKAVQFVIEDLGGQLPRTAAELLRLPGIGDYTSAAIASIAFGESIAVLDGNVERVLLRLTGQTEDATVAGRAFLQQQAAALIPPRTSGRNAPGDHNQAMMELGATICLPRAPLCLQCPVLALCRTRGEHHTPPRAKPKSRPAAYLFYVVEDQVLLERRPSGASLMPGMFELPPLPLDAIPPALEPILRLKHAITNTLYSVGVYTSPDGKLVESLPAASADLCRTGISDLTKLPLTGLARKVFRRLNLLA